MGWEFETGMDRLKWLAGGVLVASCAMGHAQDSRGRKYVPPPDTSEIHVTVVRDTNGKPIRNAAVVLHPLNKKGKDEGAMEVKTDEEGKVALDIIPIGDVLRLQIIAPGWQTFGNDYPVDAPVKDITVRLKRPGEQYSIYKSNGAGGDQANQTKVENKDAKQGNAQPPAEDAGSSQTGPPQ
jgi:hypothetical protein